MKRKACLVLHCLFLPVAVFEATALTVILHGRPHARHPSSPPPPANRAHKGGFSQSRLHRRTIDPYVCALAYDNWPDTEETSKIIVHFMFEMSSLDQWQWNSSPIAAVNSSQDELPCCQNQCTCICSYNYTGGRGEREDETRTSCIKTRRIGFHSRLEM